MYAEGIAMRNKVLALIISACTVFQLLSTAIYAEETPVEDTLEVVVDKKEYDCGAVNNSVNTNEKYDYSKNGLESCQIIEDSRQSVDNVEEDVLGVVTTMTQAQYDSKMNAFINTAKWKNGASWPKNGCVQYSYDWVNYMYGLDGPARGDMYTSISNIKAGDVVRIGNVHTFIVLSRNGNNLYTAEGDFSQKVRVSNSAYSINGSSIYERVTNKNYTFNHGYHYVDISSGPTDVFGPSVYDLQINHLTKNGFEVSCQASDDVAVKKVQFAIWTDKNGQDDLIWHDASYSNGRYVYNLKISEHNNERGLYIVHAYAWDTSDKSNHYGSSVNVEAESPAISDVKIENLSKDGYEVSCVATDNIGVTEVRFPTWTDNKGQDDIIWHQGKYSNGRWSFYVKISDHNNERGQYITHIYAYDACGNEKSYGTGAYIEAELPVISDVRIENVSKEGYEVSCVATDNVGVTEVKFPTWTEKNGQDDITWHSGSYSNGRWRFHIKISDHNNEGGQYITHIYAYDACGNEKSYGTGAYIDTESPMISEIKIENVTKNKIDISCIVNDNIGVTSVSFWPIFLGNDIKGTFKREIESLENGKWVAHFEITESDIEIERCVIQISASDACGNGTTCRSQVIELKEDIEDPSSDDKGDDSIEDKVDESPVSISDLPSLQTTGTTTFFVGDSLMVDIKDIKPGDLCVKGKAGRYSIMIDPASGKTVGVITAVKKGKVKLYTLDGRKKKTICTLKAEQPKLKSSVQLKVDKVKKLKLKGTKKKPDRWETSNQQIVSVDKAGIIDANRPGTADVTAIIGKHRFTCHVTVK